MAIIFPDDFKEGMLEYMEGGLPRFSPLILRLLGGACCAVFLTAYSPLEAPVILWVIGIILCILPAIYSTLLCFGEEDNLSDAITSIRKENKRLGFWKSVGLFLLFLLLCAVRAIHWAINYVILGGIVFLIYLAVS